MRAGLHLGHGRHHGQGGPVRLETGGAQHLRKAVKGLHIRNAEHRGEALRGIALADHRDHGRVGLGVLQGHGAVGPPHRAVVQPQQPIRTLEQWVRGNGGQRAALNAFNVDFHSSASGGM